MADAGLRTRPTPSRRKIAAWALWDCGSTGLAAIVVSFVFSVYLTDVVGRGVIGTSPASLLGRVLGAAAIGIALLAPLIGVWVESPRRRRAALAALTAVVVLLTSAMSFIRAESSYLLAGLLLLAITAACADLSGIPYNAMMRQLSTPETSGRISGLGWASGYIGTVVLLLITYVGFLWGAGDHRGVLGLPTHDGLNVRVAMVMAAAWGALFALPLVWVTFRSAVTTDTPAPKIGLLSGYRKVRQEISAEWRRDPNVVYFLLASALIRDGLAGVFTFGAVLGVAAYGVSDANVLLFGVAASAVAAIGALCGGYVDDRIGSKRVIVGSLSAVITAALILMTQSTPLSFWIFGLLLCLFIGPTETSVRALLLRLAGDGKEGVAFGLYTMTGRAVAFLAPFLFSVFVDSFHTARAGLAGLCVVLGAGLLVIQAVRVRP